MTISATIGDNGDPIGVPNFCLYILLLKMKKVESITILTAIRNSSLGIVVPLFICSHLLFKLAMANSIGMLVKRDTTSNETNS